MTLKAPSRSTPQTHQRNAEKLARIPIKVENSEKVLRKPDWIRVKIANNENITRIKNTLRETVCIQYAKKPLAPIWQNALVMAPLRL